MSGQSRSQSVDSNAVVQEALLTDRTQRPKPGPRRSHLKSRTGCKTCKKRKIKCDEQRPSCTNCRKHGKTCEFLAESSIYPNYLTGDESISTMNMLDLQLMHHFTTSTHATLSCHSTLRSFWRGPVVQMALGCDYVMRAILAVSSLHLAHHSTASKELYTSTALTYHRIAARQAMGLMSDIQKHDANNLFIFSVLTIFFALGGPRGPSDGIIFFEDSSFPEWIFLLRGTKSILEILGSDLLDGMLSPLFAQVRRAPRWTYLDAGNEARTPMKDSLDELEKLVCLDVRDPEILRIYKDAIEELRGISVSFSEGAQADISDAFTWIYQVLDDFLPLLKVPTQESLAIFSYFCVFLKKLDIHWWIQDWGERLIRKAYDLLDEEHRLWISWPMEEVGCVILAQ